MSDSTYTNLELETRILSHFLRFDNSIPMLPDFFTTKEGKALYNFLTYNKGIYEDVESFWRIWRVTLKLKNEDRERYKKFVEKLFLEEPIREEEIEFHIEEISSYVKMRSMLSYVQECLNEANLGNPRGAIEKLELGLLKLNIDFSDKVLARSDFFADFDNRFIQAKQKQVGNKVAKIPTGIAKIDEFIGGVGPQTFNLIMGETNIGKTFFLQEIAYQSYLNGLNTLFITCELSLNVIATRNDARMSGIEYSKIDAGDFERNEEKLWRERIANENKKSDAKLKISFIPEGCTIGTVESEINYWTHEGAKPDLIVIDYMDLMETKRKVWTEQELQGGIARDLRRLAQTHDLIVWSATQTAGKSYGKERLTLDDVGFSKKKAMSVNLILGIGKEEDRDDGVVMVRVIKNSLGPKGQEVYLDTDFSRGLIDIS